MLRLCDICRLPYFKSINKKDIVKEKKGLARECTPLRKPVNRKDWCTSSMIGDAKCNDDVCSITYFDDALHDSIQNMGVELVASTSSKLLEYEIKHKEIMHVV